MLYYGVKITSLMVGSDSNYLFYEICLKITQVCLNQYIKDCDNSLIIQLISNLRAMFYHIKSWCVKLFPDLLTINIKLSSLELVRVKNVESEGEIDWHDSYTRLFHPFHSLCKVWLRKNAQSKLYLIASDEDSTFQFHARIHAFSHVIISCFIFFASNFLSAVPKLC